MKILYCYAKFNPDIQYCQGMHFIAGLFYLVYKDEALAFAMYASLLKSFGLTEFYKQNSSLINLLFYQMNRLIGIYLPRLHNHLCENSVTAVYFSSAWFLTSFCYVLQYSKEIDIPQLLLCIFDKYLFVMFLINNRMDLMSFCKLLYLFFHVLKINY